MSEAQDTEERPCPHCMMVELIENFFAEYPAASGEPDAIDTDEVINQHQSRQRRGQLSKGQPVRVAPIIRISLAGARAPSQSRPRATRW
jgi:hypothetical protein